MKVSIISILFFLSCLLCNQAYGIEWNGAKPVIDKMLSYYEKYPDYSMVIADEWIKADGSREPIGDTVYAHKYKDYGYIKNGRSIQVYTEKFDIYINEEDKTIHVREVSKAELAEIAKMMPSMTAVIKYFEICDSARVVSSGSSVNTVDFYFNHPIMNRTRMLIDESGRVLEMYRYYTKPEDYTAQHTVYVLTEPLFSSSIEEFKQDNYIQVTKQKKVTQIQPAKEYKDYEVQLIKF